ncbi:glycosyltransferase [Vibrio cholerae]|nr:glycosyltransferase [Vibrio cholerae]
MNFSVLMALYKGDCPKYFQAALHSIKESTMQPSETVVAIDGPVTAELESVLDSYYNIINLKCVRLPSNVGLGNALNSAIISCDNDWIMRFDSDDICHPERFEKQLRYLEENPHVDIIGTWIAEFDDDYHNPHAFRKPPIYHQDIVDYAKSRNPFNHMTIMYRKSKVLEAGGYKDNYLYEDYALWVRMINNGAVTANMPEVLVYARTGNGMEIRRGGIKYAKSEILAQLGFYQIGFINKRQFYTNLLLRVPVRLVPGGIRKLIYRKFLR